MRHPVFIEYFFWRGVSALDSQQLCHTSKLYQYSANVIFDHKREFFEKFGVLDTNGWYMFKFLKKCYCKILSCMTVVVLFIPSPELSICDAIKICQLLYERYSWICILFSFSLRFVYFYKWWNFDPANGKIGMHLWRYRAVWDKLSYEFILKH